jgi:L-ascorbate metabolism protein UlaG (beta-lactamase superfamily)
MTNPVTVPDLAVTRVANSCVLIELGGHTVLTDPWFTERWHLHRGEPLGMAVEDLPPLTAIVASHPVPNHWDLRALRRYRHKTVPRVYVGSPRMARQATALGYPNVEHLGWGQLREPAPGLSVRAVPAGRTVLSRTNAYLISSGATRIYFGGEISDVGLLYGHHADVALLPVNGLSVPVGPRFVMGPAQALAAATVLGARVLLPIHDAHAEDPLYFWIRRHGTGRDAEALAAANPDGPAVANLLTGQRWELSPS